MANGTGTANAANVTTGTRRFDGGIYIAPLGTAVPTGRQHRPRRCFQKSGLCQRGWCDQLSERDQQGHQGVGRRHGDNREDWPERYLQVEVYRIHEPDVLKSIYGADNVTEADGAVTVKVNAKNAGAAVYVIDMAQNGGRLKRIVIPRGTVSALGDIVYKNDTPVGYDVTISAGLDTNGNTHYEYISAAAANNA